ncbi:MAG: ABC transporter substrate-binding protein [Butyrivibrio sp.]|nr:ABC transporter substrate-binding protein [Butyrivibrio sp.]
MKNQNKMFRRIFGAVFAAMITVSGCGSTPAPATDVPAAAGESAATAATTSDGAADTLTWILTSDINSMDPTQAYDDVTNMVVNQVTEGILNFDSENKLVTNIAKSWECVDPTTYVYEIRDDVTFSDGSPLTMDDVLFSIERNRDPQVASLVGWMYDSVDTIEQTGDWELTVKLAEPDATWQYAFATTAGHIIEKAAFESDGSIVGTGAYKLDTWNSGSQIILTRNENFTTSSDPIFYNKIVYNVITEDTTRVEALTTGQADFSLNPPLDMIPQLEESPNVVVNMFDTFGIDFLAFNTAKAPFDDVYVRMAVASAIDIDSIYDSLLSTTCTKSTQLPFSPVLYPSVGSSSDWEAYASNYRRYNYDIEKAKEYLSQSAYPDGFSCKLAVNSSSLKNSEALYIQAALAELGITVEIEKMTDVDNYNIQFGSTWDSANNCRDFDMGFFTWYADYPDISGNLVPLFLSDNAEVGGSNTSAYSNPEVDSLLKEQLTKTDPAERAKLMMEALDKIGEDVPMVLMDYPKQGALESTSLNNFKVNASYVWNIYVREMTRE